MNGFIRLPRHIYRALRKKPAALAVYLEIADRARFAPGREVAASRGLIDLAIGEAVIGRDDLASTLRLTASKVRTALDLLQQLGVIAITTTSRGTIAKVHSDEEIRDVARGESPARQPTDRQPLAGEPPAHRPQVATSSPADHQPIATNEEGTQETERGEGKRERESDAREAGPTGSVDRAHAARMKLRDQAWDRLNAFRLELAEANGWTDVKPLHPFDTGRTELATRIVESGDRAAENLNHVLDVLLAEARAKNSVEYLTGSAFEARSWRRKLGMRVEDAQKRSRAGRFDPDTSGHGHREDAASGDLIDAPRFPARSGGRSFFDALDEAAEEMQQQREANK